MSIDAKIIIAYTHLGTTAEFLRRIMAENVLKVVACVSSGEKVLSLVRKYKPDFLVLDSALTGVCGLDILRQISAQIEDRPFIIMYCEKQNDIYWQLAYRYSADLILEKPADPAGLIEKIYTYLTSKQDPICIDDCDFTSRCLEVKVTKVLYTLGLPPNFKGFHYLRHALILVAQDSEKLFSVTKILYSQIAEQFGVSNRSVEHSIQTAIQSIWNSCNFENLKEALGFTINTNQSPTNVEFISLLSDAIRLNMI
ncbi:MAG: sporulation initiation factor Spo0A C-terminal domain-containing protein [Clostridia bacterium]|jgi:two-component system response regulator (stage 0 sporulation protein A)|nr:sporulation initiation factor Spo0A C-terminal domain-containing protein [Clostridia bacterium]